MKRFENSHDHDDWDCIYDPDEPEETDSDYDLDFEVYSVDAHSEWVNGAYDDNGDAVTCSRCGEEMAWSPISCCWVCDTCDTEMGREEYFNYIGAEPPGDMCIHGCDQNYPICKRTCPHYEIDRNDPMLT